MSAKVLVADDSSTMRRIIARHLNGLGVSEVVEAGDGDAALECFKQGDFKLVITDWNMPGKSGLEVIQAIRAGGAQTPIIMVTTEAEKRRVLEAIHAGVSDYLIKPFTPEALCEKVDKFISA